MIERLLRRISVLILPEDIELDFRSEIDPDIFILCRFDGIFEDKPCVALERLAVRVRHITEHARDPSVDRPPRHDGDGFRIRMQKKIRTLGGAKPGDGRGINGNSLLHRPRKLARHNCNVLLVSERIDECESDEFHILLFHKFTQIIVGFHAEPPAISAPLRF